ncbi:hypothetical protein [Listeria monocytogenes]|uniref:hypothetical protein n=1 Tax=Listeria monocytogenes TaxID=1639 RepID=UPI000BDF217D|nr:hypothetical protein [Listeria monocytogenes]EAD5497789.1 hypothetical protein [Listeria monocytogenes]MCB2540076.1 hypothetical protein [Listeria monocytogenes]MCB2628581.1 hypothetical protein [Listeria monocytogenes]MCB2759424.1 hypothetical protein [Listeria monocytogenes]PCT70917.1 hypothetical protein A7P02_13480 [Listeria monocytogenes]
MAYRDYIEEAIRNLYKKAPNDPSIHTLEEFNQQDVADTVNQLHLENSTLITETTLNYSNTAEITFDK